MGRLNALESGMVPVQVNIKHMTVEETINRIAVLGRGKVETVEVGLTLYLREDKGGSISYRARAWRGGGPQPCPMASGYSTDSLLKQMETALAAYSSPETDKQREIENLRAKLAELERAK